MAILPPVALENALISAPLAPARAPVGSFARPESAPGQTNVFPIRVLELRSARGTGGGPDKTILYGAAAATEGRVAVTVCYVRDARDRVFGIDSRARRLGIDYVEVLERHSFDPAIWPALRRIVRERGIDVVHAHDYKTDLLALLLARAEGVIPVATAHGWSGDSTRERFYYAADRRLLNRYPVVIAVSQPIRQRLLKGGASPERVRHIRNGVDAGVFRRDAAARARMRATLSIDEHTILIGAVGRLAPEKRFDLLVEVAAAQAASAPVHLAIAGEGPCRDDLTRQAASLGIADRVRLVGQLDDVRDFHQALDIYVQTSDVEGVPNAVLEAMAMETPVVATDVGGTCELVDDGVHGLLVPPQDVAALSRAITSTRLDGEAARHRVCAARARIERELSFQARVAAVEDIYEELVVGRLARP